MADIILKRGQESNRTSFTPLRGEPLVSFDDTTGKPRLFVGTGTDIGGIEIGASESSEIISSLPSTISSFKGYKIKKFRIRISANDLNNDAMLGHFSVKPLGGSWTDDPTDFVITKGVNSSYNLNPTITHFGFEYGEHVPWTVCNIPSSGTYDGTFVEFTLSFADGLAKEIDRLIFAGTNTHTGKYHAMSLAVQIESEAGSNADGSDGTWRDMVLSGSMQYNSTASLDTSYKWIIIDNESYTPEFIMDLGWKKIKKARLRISGNSLDFENVGMQRFLFYDENNSYADNTMLTWVTGKYSSSNLIMNNGGAMFYDNSASADVGRPINHRAEAFLELVVTFNDVRKLTKVDVMLDDNTDQNYEMFCVDVQFEDIVGVNADGSDGTWYRIILPRSISGTMVSPGHYIQYIANNLVESKEDALGNPSYSAYYPKKVLSSTSSGTRSWEIPSNIRFWQLKENYSILKSSPRGNWYPEMLLDRGVAEDGRITYWDGLGVGYPDKTWNQSTSTKQPLRIENILNGYPVARFDGMDDEMYTEVNLGSRYTVFVVAKIPTIASYKSIIGHQTQSNNTDFNMILHAGGGIRSGHVVNDTPYWTPEVAIEANKWYVFVSRYSGNEIITRFNGNTVGNLITSVDPITSTENMRLAKYHNADTWLGIDVAEIVLFNTNLGDIDMHKVEGYLHWKFGLQNSLVFGHMFAGSPPMILM